MNFESWIYLPVKRNQARWCGYPWSDARRWCQGSLANDIFVDRIQKYITAFAVLSERMPSSLLQELAKILWP